MTSWIPKICGLSQSGWGNMTCNNVNYDWLVFSFFFFFFIMSRCDNRQGLICGWGVWCLYSIPQLGNTWLVGLQNSIRCRWLYIYIYGTPPKISGTKFIIVMSYVLDMSQTYHTISLSKILRKIGFCKTRAPLFTDNLYF